MSSGRSPPASRRPGCCSTASARPRRSSSRPRRPLTDPEVLRRGYFQGAIATNRELSYRRRRHLQLGRRAGMVPRACIGDVPHETIIAEAAAVAPGSRGVVFLPHLVQQPAAGARHRIARRLRRPVAGSRPRNALPRRARGPRPAGALGLDGMAGLPGVTPVGAIRIIGGGSRNPLFLQHQGERLWPSADRRRGAGGDGARRGPPRRHRGRRLSRSRRGAGGARAPRARGRA